MDSYNASTAYDSPLRAIQQGVETLQYTSGGLLQQVLAYTNAWSILATLLLSAILYDQCSYIYQKGSIMGPVMKIPFIGPFLESVNPNFDKYVAKWNSGPLSCVSVFHKFVILAGNNEMSRKVFNSPAFAQPCVVDVAYKLLRPENWVFLDGKAHVDYRKGLNGLFNRTALARYLPGQEETYLRYFDLFVKVTEQDMAGNPTPFMPYFRELQMAVSCRSFVGHYMADETVKKLAFDYFNITNALELVNFPFIIPFTKTWYGKKASDQVIDEFSRCAAKSKVRMAAGGEPNCILDLWVSSMIASQKYRERIAAGVKPEDADKPEMVLREFSDLEIAMTLLTFLFASQDATTSACTWLFQLLADRPAMLDRLREENLTARGGDKNMPLSLELLEKLKYTRAVVKETLRYRPPVTMVPYRVKKPWKITETYTAPKGAMIVPACWPSLHDPEIYPDPDTFIPDRWITGTAEQQSKNWLVFGTGPHVCLGQTYAMNNLISMIGMASMHLDWEHKITPVSETIRFFATIFPKDDCFLTFSRRP